MDLMDPYKVIQRPHVSEKAHAYVQDQNTYTFRVHPEATKSDIKAAVKAIWNVDAKSVRTISMPSKLRRFGRIPGRTSPWKKAIVRLPADQAIEALR